MMEITKRIYFLTWLLACIEMKTDTLYTHTHTHSHSPVHTWSFLSVFSRYTVAPSKVFAKKSNKKGNNVEKTPTNLYSLDLICTHTHLSFPFPLVPHILAHTPNTTVGQFDYVCECVCVVRATNRTGQTAVAHFIRYTMRKGATTNKYFRLYL